MGMWALYVCRPFVTGDKYFVKKPNHRKFPIVPGPWASTRLRGFAKKTGADQPAHPRSLISDFVIRFWKVSYVNLLQVKF